MGGAARGWAGDGDRVLDAILVLFAALVAQSPRDLQTWRIGPILSRLGSVLSSVGESKDCALVSGKAIMGAQESGDRSCGESSAYVISFDAAVDVCPF